MKKIYWFCFIMFYFGLTNLNAQNDSLLCTPTGGQNTWNGQIGGYALPSEGTISVLFVFAQFPDDNFSISNSTWVKGQAPTNMQSWVDLYWSINPTQGSMTHYFNDMSFNKLKFIGKTVSVVTPQTRAWYLANNKKRGDIHTEIIQQLDQTWDFAQFDNWNYEGNYNHINQPDGIVDMVFMVWRNIAHEFSYPQDSIIYANLKMGRYGDLGYGWPDILVDNEQRRLKMGFWPSGNTPGGSGATMTDWFSENMFRFCIHQFGHYLQGGNDQHVGHGFWGLLSGWGVKSYVANAFERYRLGWINLNTIEASPNQTILNATLPDYVTTGIAYRFVIDAATHQYFYIENHQKQSIWETTMAYPDRIIENGLYLLRQEGASGDNTFIKCLPAEGRWNWTVNQLTPNPWGSGDLPVFKKLNVDRVNGYHDLQFIPWYWNGIYQGEDPIHFIENQYGNPIEYIANQGDGKDAFRTEYNELFSPFSNPNSQRADKTVTPFGFKINGFFSGVVSLDLYVGTSLEGTPSKPQNLTYTVTSDRHPKLIWEGNLEPDMYLYKIYRYNDLNSTPVNIGVIFHIPGQSSYNFIDVNVTVPRPREPAGDHKFYRVSAQDNQWLESVKSDYLSAVSNQISKDI